MTKENIVQEEEYRGYQIKIETDDMADDPRNWDNLGHMVCFHRRYSLGDNHDCFANNGNFTFYDKEYKEWLCYDDEPEDFTKFLKNEKPIYLPIYAYEHSGITISTGRSYPYNDRWDSGQLGYIYVTRKEVMKEYGWKLLTKSRIKKIEEHLNNEVNIYDQYLTGDVYGYIVEDKDGEHIDSCWGFYGDDGIEQAIQQGKDAVDYEIKEKHEHKMKLAEISRNFVQSKLPFSYASPEVSNASA